MCDSLDRCYAVADDGEAAVLDGLIRRAGLVWFCGECRWNNLTTTTSCEQCSTHRYVDLVPEEAEQPCGCGGTLEPNGTNLHYDEATATGTVGRTCRSCQASSTYGWTLDPSDYRCVFGHEFGSEY